MVDAPDRGPRGSGWSTALPSWSGSGESRRPGCGTSSPGPRRPRGSFQHYFPGGKDQLVERGAGLGGRLRRRRGAALSGRRPAAQSVGIVRASGRAVEARVQPPAASTGAARSWPPPPMSRPSAERWIGRCRSALADWENAIVAALAAMDIPGRTAPPACRAHAQLAGGRDHAGAGSAVGHPADRRRPRTRPAAGRALSLTTAARRPVAGCDRPQHGDHVVDRRRPSRRRCRRRALGPAGAGERRWPIASASAAIRSQL